MIKKSRTENSILNINFSMISQFVKIIFAFLSRTVFIHILGKEILGINGVYASILSYLSLSELGIATAITFTLYKPIADNNIEKIKSILEFYRIIYKIIGASILGMGLLVLPFLNTIVSGYNLTLNLYLAYIIYLINIASTYLLFSYRQVILIASQRKHRIEQTNIICYLITNVLQILFLYLTKNYLVYLLIQFVTQNLQQYWIYHIVGKEYPYITKKKSSNKLKVREKKEIGNIVFSISLFKIGQVVLNSTDNIIISIYIGISEVGIYSNYHLLVSTVAGFIGLIFTSLTASVGNLNVSVEPKKRELVFNKMFLTATILYSVAGMFLFQLLNPFIQIWLGNDFIFSDIAVLVFVIDFILAGFMIPIDTFKDACGVFRIGRYRPLLTVIVNIIMSIILAQYFGITGIVLATSISRITTTFWIDSRYTYKIVFQRKALSYYKSFIQYLMFTFVGMGILYIGRILLNLVVSNIYLYFIITLGYTCLFTISYVYVIYRRKKEFIELKDMFLGILAKVIQIRN